MQELSMRSFGPLYGFQTFVRTLVRQSTCPKSSGLIPPNQQATMCYDCFTVALAMPTCMLNSVFGQKKVDVLSSLSVARLSVGLGRSMRWGPGMLSSHDNVKYVLILYHAVMLSTY